MNRFLKKQKNIFWIYLPIIIGIISMLIFGLSLNCEKTVAEAEVIYSAENNVALKSTYSHEYAYMSYEHEYCLNSSTIEIPFRIVSDGTIQHYTYDETNFIVVSSRKIDETQLMFSLQCLNYGDNYELHISIMKSDGEVLNAALYAIYNEYGIFVSKFSQEDAMEKYINYALKNAILTEWEADEIRYENLYGKETYQEDNVDGEVFSETISGSSVLSTEGDTSAYGKVQWHEGSSVSSPVHPLRRVKVELRNSNLIGSQLLGTTYTDNDGQYTVKFNNSTFAENGGCDLFIRVYAGDNNAYVVKNDGSTKYYKDTSHTAHQNVATGSDTEINLTLNMSSDTAKAMQISQAIMTAQDFAWVMSGTLPKAVKVVYPADGTYYNGGSSKIYINGSSDDPDYADWDVIMHEYGHHIAYNANIDNSPGGWHNLGVNMSDHYSGMDTTNCGADCARHRTNSPIGASGAKSAGNRIAWSEAWATVFGAIAQEYYYSKLTGIPNVADKKYTDVTGSYSFEYSYESGCRTVGEANESSIIGVLWDLFDVGAEEDDNIGLGYQAWWDVTVNSKAKTFSELVQYFYQQYPEKEIALGANLTHYNIAPSEVSVNGSTSKELTVTPPTFIWEPQGGSQNFPNNNFTLIIYNSDCSAFLDFEVGASSSFTLTDAQWRSVLFLSGETLHIAVRGYQTDSPTTGGYLSRVCEFTRPVYTTSEPVNGEVIITGFYGGLSGDVTIPSEINGNTVVGIGEKAFRARTFTSVTLPSTIRTIGSQAFQSCLYLTTVNMSNSQVTRIESRTFDYCKVLENIKLPSSVNYIGESAFGYTQQSNFILPETITAIGAKAFKNCDNTTFFVENNSSRPAGWNSDWNNSNRPVVWGCTLSSDKSYVVSFVKSATNPDNVNAVNGISKPVRSGYTFNGWYAENDSSTVYNDITAAPNGVLFAKWTKNSCIATGSLITLADGSQMAVEDLTGNEMLLVWNMLTGTFDIAPILFIDRETAAMCKVIILTFSDGTKVKVIDEHAFFNITLGEYVFLRADAEKYIGDYFNKRSDNGSWTSVQLVDVTIKDEYTMAWSPVTYGHLCYYVNGMLSMPGATEGFINIFDVDVIDMKYNAEQMAADIETYGLFSYEEFNAIIPVEEEIFNAFNGQYLKVSIGKGLISLQEIHSLLERYAEFF